MLYALSNPALHIHCNMHNYRHEPNSPANIWCDRDNEAMTLKSPDRQTGTCTVTVTTKQPPRSTFRHVYVCNCFTSPWGELPGSHHPYVLKGQEQRSYLLLLFLV